MNVLVTGGAGYIGCSLLEQLHALDSVQKVVVYDNFSRENFSVFWGHRKYPKVSFIRADILDSFSLQKALTDIDTVIHLAGFVAFPFNHLQNFQYEQINCWGSLNVVNCIRESKRVKKVLYLSSFSVYGFREQIGFMDEPSPGNGYGDSKYKGEQYFGLLGNSHQLSVFRPANVFGYNKAVRLDNVINAFIFDSLAYGKINIFGSGNQNRCFVELNGLVKRIADWVDDKDTAPLTVLADFNASLNEVKDWLLTKNDGLEYQYINQNQTFASQSSNIAGDRKDQLLDMAYASFYNNMVV